MFAQCFWPYATIWLLNPSAHQASFALMVFFICNVCWWHYFIHSYTNICMSFAVIHKVTYCNLHNYIYKILLDRLSYCSICVCQLLRTENWDATVLLHLWHFQWDDLQARVLYTTRIVHIVIYVVCVCTLCIHIILPMGVCASFLVW